LEDEEADKEQQPDHSITVDTRSKMSKRKENILREEHRVKKRKKNNQRNS